MIKQITPNMVINSFIEHYLKFVTESDMFRHKRTVQVELGGYGIDLSRSSRLSGLLKEAPVITGINSGDCGVAAIAIGWVFSQIHPESDIAYFNNGEHGYLSIDGVLYDTIYRFGVKEHSLMYGAKATQLNNPLTLDEICKAFIVTDIQGQEMINTFCESWNVPGISFAEYNTGLSTIDIDNELNFTQKHRDTAIKEL